jgi:hypothetical protein
VASAADRWSLGGRELRRLGAPGAPGEFMNQYEITYLTANAPQAAKSITALVCEPDRVGPNTGALLLTHGWGNSRFQDRDKIAVACDVYDLVCVSVEYRQSGLAHDPVSGHGWDCPYDLSFYQLFDVPNGLREGEPVEVTATKGGSVAGRARPTTPEDPATYTLRPWTWTDAVWHYDDGSEFVYPAYNRLDWSKE